MSHWFAATVKFAVVWLPAPPVSTTTPVDAGGPAGLAVTVAVTVTVTVAGEAGGALSDAAEVSPVLGAVVGVGPADGELARLACPIAMPPTSAMPASATMPSTARGIRLGRCPGLDIAAFQRSRKPPRN